jgi:hypothetical protein
VWRVKPVELQFDEETHVYSVNGVRIPSVTQVLQDVGIVDYSFIPAEQRELYLARGRRVHAMTHFDDEGDLDEGTVAEDERGYLEAWRRFRGQHCPTPMLRIEKRYFHPTYRYAGTIDRLTAAITLIDAKSGHTPWWVGVQLAAYGELVQLNEGVTVGRHIAVELHEDGTFRECRELVSNHRANLNTFYAALRIYHAKQKKGVV